MKSAPVTGSRLARLLLFALRWSAIIALIVLLWPAQWGGRLQVTVVNGQSMTPTYQSGDIVVSWRHEDYQIGQVVVYHPSSLTCDRCNVVHRIVDKSAQQWITQGDNNVNIDPWTPTSHEITGQIFWLIPASAWSWFIFSPFAWLTILGALGSVYLTMVLWNVLNEDESSPAPAQEDTDA